MTSSIIVLLVVLVLFLLLLLLLLLFCPLYDPEQNSLKMQRKYSLRGDWPSVGKVAQMPGPVLE